MLFVLVFLRFEVVLRISSNPRFLYLGYQCRQKDGCKVSPRPKRVVHYVYDEAKQIYAMITPVVSTPQQRLVEPLGNLRRQEKIKTTKNYVEQVDPVETDDCKLRYEWQKSFRPTCNMLHEFDLSTPSTPINGTVDTKYRIIGNGYWRDVWVTNNSALDEKLVFKSMIYEHDFTLRNFDRMRRDAAVMDRLSFSDYIIDLYGFCGTSSFSEYGDGGDVLSPLENGLTPRERLQIGTFLLQHIITAGRSNIVCSPCCSYHCVAAQVSTALADLHNADHEGEASIAHTDIAPGQFIKVGDHFKLNDFNRARFLAWSTSQQKPCPYHVANNGGKFRSPEEYLGKPQTEMVRRL
jgi:serine/threonine protein kinase